MTVPQLDYAPEDQVKGWLIEALEADGADIYTEFNWSGAAADVYTENCSALPWEKVAIEVKGNGRGFWKNIHTGIGQCLHYDIASGDDVDVALCLHPQAATEPVKNMCRRARVNLITPVPVPEPILVEP